jgi:hypothetical protein
MRANLKGWVVVALVVGVTAYCVAEEITLTTYYPSPRGVYNELQSNIYRDFDQTGLPDTMDPYPPGIGWAVDPSGTSQLNSLRVTGIDLFGNLTVDGTLTVTQGALLATVGGSVGIGKPDPEQKLHVAGNVEVDGNLHADGVVAADGGIVQPSDTRLKTNILPLTQVLEKLDQIRGVSFEWNGLHQSAHRDTSGRHIGVIAQDVEAVFPELVTSWEPEGYKAVDYGKLSAVLLEAVKELKREQERLQERVEALELKQ